MTNVHTPQRLEGESPADYKARRKQSAAIVRVMRLAHICHLGGVTRGGQSSRGILRDQQRENGNLRGIFGRGLQNAANRKRLKQQKKLNHLRDEHGAFTLVGRGPGHCAAWDETGALNNPGRIFPVGCGEVRRVWLAGISAIRGY